jgi:CheY-like chemotaxis protein
MTTALTFASILECEHYEVCSVHDGNTALAVVASFDPCVILLDLGLPDTDGYLVATTLRQRFPARAICLIAVTGYGSPEDRAQSLQSGFDHHLVKPVAAGELLRLVGEVCKAPRPV